MKNITKGFLGSALLLAGSISSGAEKRSPLRELSPEEFMPAWEAVCEVAECAEHIGKPPAVYVVSGGRIDEFCGGESGGACYDNDVNAVYIGDEIYFTGTGRHDIRFVLPHEFAHAIARKCLQIPTIINTQEYADGLADRAIKRLGQKRKPAKRLKNPKKESYRQKFSYNLTYERGFKALWNASTLAVTCASRPEQPTTLLGERLPLICDGAQNACYQKEPNVVYIDSLKREPIAEAYTAAAIAKCGRGGIGSDSMREATKRTIEIFNNGPTNGHIYMGQ
ncbi:MAG: hypothetical protein HY513_04435 [Candidatus Aenigmarchaeota archaeon]|nr:hypothetical protein [Candidatus Aenigmarchaeota archaeon]